MTPGTATAPARKDAAAWIRAVLGPVLTAIFAIAAWAIAMGHKADTVELLHKQQESEINQLQEQMKSTVTRDEFKELHEDLLYIRARLDSMNDKKAAK